MSVEFRKPNLESSATSIYLHRSFKLLITSLIDAYEFCHTVTYIHNAHVHGTFFGLYDIYNTCIFTFA